MPTFDGPNRRIILDSAVTEVDVGPDIYSEWKEWVKLPANADHAPAFRPEGGSPINPTVNTGSYFFLRNDLGWRLRPPEESINITLTGNLVPEDFLLPVLVPTLGAFTVLVQGLQPITQNAQPLIDAFRLIEASVAGNVTIDTDDRTIRIKDSQGNDIRLLDVSVDGRVRTIL